MEPQRTRELSCPDVFVKLCLSFPSLQQQAISEKLLLSVIVQALQQMYGAVGGAVPLELLQFQAESKASSAYSIFQIAKGDLGKLQSACAFLSTYDGQPCLLRVERASPFLSSLAANSRTYVMDHLAPQLAELLQQQ